ncbi:hypothetical protein [Sporosalibacterium faouarense]|uniref:hypothetical protein n=1 Tax=Sporosalibacterium faouarense TaxID=516123 RepID=UPI00192C5CBF|nr:hypothetical protein [Sporosalibacterium faouarense]
MKVNKIICNELYKLGFNNLREIKIEEIRDKDGVFLFRIKTKKDSYILKYFSNEEYTREIKNYEILKGLNIKTIKNYGYTDKSILLEDLETSTEYRLGVCDDLKDIQVAKALAKWYINLHDKGIKYIEQNESSFYRESDVIVKENIEFIRMKTNTENNKVWDLVIDNLGLIQEKINIPEKTFNYNDFYWTNLVVSRDKSEAFMFDYNFLGIGFRYCDINNVCSSLSKEAREVFVKEYGYVSTKEEVIYDFTAIIITLFFAYKREVFPSWAKESLDAINKGKLEEATRKVLEL